MGKGSTERMHDRTDELIFQDIAFFQIPPHDDAYSHYKDCRDQSCYPDRKEGKCLCYPEVRVVEQSDEHSHDSDRDAVEERLFCDYLDVHKAVAYRAIGEWEEKKDSE